MRTVLAVIALLGFWFLAGWSLVSGIADLYDYIFNDVATTGMKVAWAVLRIIPIAEILFAIGWFAGWLTLISGKLK